MNAENAKTITALMDDIKRLTADITTAEKAYNKRIAVIKDEYMASVAVDVKSLDTARKTLMKHVKKNKGDIFPAKTDRVTVTGGILIRQIKNAVRKAKHIKVDFLKKMGKTDAVRTEEFVDWDTIETWSDSQLAEINTDRKPKETFAYELTEK